MVQRALLVMRSFGIPGDRAISWFRGGSIRERTPARDELRAPATPSESHREADVDATLRDLQKSVRQLLRREERMAQRIHAFESELVAEVALLTDRLHNLEVATEAIERRQESADRRL